MVSAEDIKMRVEQADRDRITARADAAALVGQRLAQLDEAQQKIKETESQLATAINEATALMNLAELATFVDSSVSKLTAASKARGRARGSRKPRKSATDESNHQPEA